MSIKITIVFTCLLCLSGCSQMRSANKGAKPDNQIHASEIKQLEESIEIQQEEIALLRKWLASVRPVVDDELRNRMRQTHDRLFPQTQYVRALPAMNVNLSRQCKALQAEAKVIHDSLAPCPDFGQP